MSTQPSSAGKQSGPLSERLRFYGDEFVFDSVSGMFHRLNPSASFMLRALIAGATPEELPRRLQAHYALDSATAARDAQLFLNSLAALEPLGRLFEAARKAS
jgi:hypothetical protein